MKRVAIINYNAGNIRSVLFALERLGIAADLTDAPERIREADRVIFPGVGEARSTMDFLHERGLDDLIRSLEQPVLGICLGAQLLCAHSEERDTPCLGIIPQRVRKFIPQQGEKVPHMGWNQIHLTPDCWIRPELDGQFTYFVHSYYIEPGPWTVATTPYCQEFSSVLHHKNFYATQFHPEKSGPVGAKILEDFLNVCP